MRIGWNKNIPDHARPLHYKGEVIGWCWKAPAPLKRLCKSNKKYAPTNDRYTVITLDGLIVTKTSPTLFTAKKSLRTAIKRRLSGPGGNRYAIGEV